MSDFFQHIVDNNPGGAADLCRAYQLDVQNTDEVEQGLYIIVDQGGEQGLRDVLQLHPEKNMLLDMFGNSSEVCQDEKCMGCRLNRMLIATNQADGARSAMQATPAPSNPHQLSVMLQTNTLLAIGIISFTIMAVVIIHKQKGN